MFQTQYERIARGEEQLLESEASFYPERSLVLLLKERWILDIFSLFKIRYNSLGIFNLSTYLNLVV